MSHAERIKVAKTTIASEFGEFISSRSETVLSQQLNVDSIGKKPTDWLSAHWKYIAVGTVCICIGIGIGIGIGLFAGYYANKKL